MRDLDLAPLWRSTVGFDRLFDLLEDRFVGQVTTTIRRTTSSGPGKINTEFRWRLPALRRRRSRLWPSTMCSGSKGARLRRAIMNTSTRASRRVRSQRVFNLADHVEVKGASFTNGLLTIELVREIPEAMKPRRIAIASGSANQPRQTIEHDEAA